MLLFCLLWLGCALFLVVTQWHDIVQFKLPDTDDNLRLMQIRDWLGGQGWFDLRQYRLDPPAGADIHWTRLIDLPYALIITLFTPLMGNGLAEHVAVTLVPLLILGATMAGLAAIVRRAVGPDAWAWPMVLLMMATPVVGMMSPLRIDHHGAQLLCLVLMLWGLGSSTRLQGGLVAGAALATSLVIGVEMLPYLAIGAACAVTFWIIDEQEHDRLRGFGVGAASITLIGLYGFIPPAARFSHLCDQLTASYYPAVLGGSAALLAAGLIPLRRWQLRLAGAGLAGLIAIALLLTSGGDSCITDPYRAIDPDARRLWLDSVGEALPLWKQDLQTILSMPVFPLFGLAGALWMWRRQTGDDRRIWGVILLIGTASILLCLLSTRAGIPAQLLAIPGAAALMAAGRARLVANARPLARVLGTVLWLGVVSGMIVRLVIVAFVPDPTAQVASPQGSDKSSGKAAGTGPKLDCLTPAALATLNHLPAGTMMAAIDLSPALLVHSHQRAVAGPYHRNGAAIAGVMNAFAGTEAAAHDFIRAHHTDYVLICPSLTEHEIYQKRAPSGFQQQLLAGKAPAWLVPLPSLPAYRLFRVK